MPPPNYNWEFAIPGDPLPSLVTSPAPEHCVIGAYSNGLTFVVVDGHGAIRHPSAGLMIRRAQQYLISLFGVLDPRVHGMVCELEDRPQMLLVVNASNGAATVLPTALAMDFLKSVNAGPVLARSTPAAS